MRQIVCKATSICSFAALVLWAIQFGPLNSLRLAEGVYSVTRPALIITAQMLWVMWLVLLAHGSAEAELFWGDVLSSLINAAKMVFGLFMAGGLCGYWFGLPLVAVIPTFDSEVAILCGAAFIGYYACFMSSAGLIMDIFFNRGKQREKGVIKLRLFPW